MWNTNLQNYCDRNAKKASFKKLLHELNDAAFVLDEVEALKKKIKNTKDGYRGQVNEIKKSMKSGIDYRYIKINQVHKKHNGGNIGSNGCVVIFAR